MANNQAFLPIIKSTLVKLPIANGNIKFGDIAILRDKRVVYVESYRDDKITKTPDGNTPVDDSAINALFLTLVVDGNIRPIENLPFTDLIKADNQGIIQPLNYLIIDWVNSFIYCADSTAVSDNAGNYVLLRVQYEDSPIGAKC